MWFHYYVSVDAVKSRWHYLKENYRRELGKGGHSKWKYLHQMSFLHDLSTPRRLVGNVHPPHQKDTSLSPSGYDNESIVQVLGEQETGNTTTTEVSQKLFKSLKKRLRSEEDAPGDQRLLKKVKNARLEELMSIEDEDYFFLMSLLPHLRTIPQHQKLHTRIKMQQTLLEDSCMFAYHPFSPSPSPSQESNWNSIPSPSPSQENNCDNLSVPTGEVEPVQQQVLTSLQ